MWRWRHKRQDDDALRADVNQLQRQVGAFMAICAEYGADVGSAAGDAVDGVPPTILMASRTRSAEFEPVLVTYGGRQAIAVIGPAGTAEPIWADIRRELA